MPALVAVATLALLPLLARAHPGHARALAILALATAAALATLAALGPSAVPTSWVLVLREGRESAVLEALWTPEPWVGHLSPPWRVPLRATVAAHLGMAVVAAALVAGHARVAVGGLGALAVTTALVTTAWFDHAALSHGPELPVTLAGLLAWTGWAGRRLPHPAARALAVAVVAGSAALAAGLRRETLAVTVPLLLWTAADAAGLRLPSLRRLEAAPWPLRILAAVALSSAGLTGLALALRAAGTVRGASHDAALLWDPEHLLTLRLPVDLLGYGSLGWAALVLLGLGVAATRSLPHLLLVAAVLFLLRLYALESHLGAAPFEGLRYPALLLGALAAYATGGAAWVAARLGRRAPLAWWAVLAAAWVRPLAPPGVPPTPGALADGTQPTGARFALEVAEAFPRCVLVTRLATEVVDGTGPQHAWTYRWDTVFHGLALAPAGPTPDPDVVVGTLRGRGLADPTPLPLPPGWPPELAAAPCVVFVWGLDCNLRGADCDAWAEGLAPVVEVEVEVPEWNVHHGGHARPLRLGAYALRRTP